MTGAKTLDAEEIERRSPVWRALSDLFLDTELDRRDLRAIAETIKTACFSVEEAEEILYQEVAPVFFGNLMTTAGEWQPWDEEQVREMVCGRLQKKRHLFSWLEDFLCRRVVKLIRLDWLQVRRYLEQQELDAETES